MRKLFLEADERKAAVMKIDEVCADASETGIAEPARKSVDLSRGCSCLLERSPLPMFIVDGAERRVSYVNPAFCRLIGKESQELLGNPVAKIALEGWDENCSTLLEQVYRRGTSDNAENQEQTIRSCDTEFWTYTMWTVFVQNEQSKSGVMIYVANATESISAHQSNYKLNLEIREINQELVIAGIRERELAEAAAENQQQLFQAQKMEGLGRLAGGIAHDFNNMLTAILGYTELAGETLGVDDAVQDYLRNIRKAADRAALLTNQLLAFARKQIIEPKIVNLNVLIMEIDEMLRRLIGEHIELGLLLQSDLGQARIDPGQFGQALINLTVNARDAMPDGGKITIETKNISLDAKNASELEDCAPGDYVLVRVSDTGTGIPIELQSHLFEPFFTTKDQGKGTGLGLATCYGIVKQSGGQIHVESASGEGVVFSIYLPRETKAITPSQREIFHELPVASGTILLVEDEPMVRDIGAKILRGQGYVVLEAENGIDALRLISDYPDVINLLVTDVVMPKMGGRELADRLSVLLPGIKVLYTSGYTDDSDVHQRILEPGSAFLQKPFLPLALVKKAHEVLSDE